MTSTEGSVACALCGTIVPGAPLTPMTENDPRRGLLCYCERCARERLRSVEARLPREWW